MTEKKKSLRVHRPGAAGQPQEDQARRSFASSFKNQQQSAEPMKALGIKITAARHRKLKQAAMDRDTTMSELISEFIDNLEN